MPIYNDKVSPATSIRLPPEIMDLLDEYQRKNKIKNRSLAISHCIRTMSIIHRFIISDNRQSITTWYSPSNDHLLVTPLDELLLRMSDQQKAEMLETLVHKVLDDPKEIERIRKLARQFNR